MRALRKLFFGLLIADLVATVLFFGLSRLVDQTGKVDGGAGVVFYSGNGAEASARINTGVQLLTDGQLDRLIMVGGHRPQEGVTGSQDMALEAIRRSGKGGQISADVVSRDTFSGIRNVEELAEARGASEVVFISNCMHLVRARTAYGVVSDGEPPARAACSSIGWNPLRIWKTAHYEAAAWVYFIMPESWRDGILNRLRGSEDGDAAA